MTITIAFNSVGTGATGTPESSSLLKFGASEGFDPFLALTEPPPAPHGSPRYPGGQQHLEHDSDEEQPEFTLSIKSVFVSINQNIVRVY